MSLSRLSLFIALACTTPLAAQPEKVPPAPDAEQASKRLYAEGAWHAKRGLFLDAVKAMEECLRLDPDAVPPRRMLASLYLTVGRPDDALAMAKSVTEKAPDDFEAWDQYATQLKDLRRVKEAIAALNRAVECKSAAKHPEQLSTLLSRLGQWAFKSDDFATAESAQRSLIDVLDANRQKFRNSGFLSDDDFRGEKAAACERLGETRLKEGKLDGAAAAFDQARALFQGRSDTQAKLWSYRLHLQLAQVYAARKDPQTALEHLQIYLKNVTPASIEPYRLLFELAPEVSGESALPLLAEYAAKAKDNLPLQLLLAETYTKFGKFNGAETLYLELLKKHAKPEVYLGLFRLYERSGRIDDVLARLDEQVAVLDDEISKEEPRKKAAASVRSITAALLKQPSLILKLVPAADAERAHQAHKDPPNFRYSTFERLGQLALQTDRLDEAERLIRQASQSPTGRFFRVANDYILIQVLRARRDFEAVKSLCKDRIENREQIQHVADNRPLYSRFLYQALLSLGDIDEALRINAETIEIERNEELKYSSRLYRAEILYQAGRDADAAAECEQVLKDFPQPKFERGAQLKLAMILSHQRKFTEGEKLLRALLERDPDDARACNFLGYELADQNRSLDEAERLIHRAIDLDRRARQSGEGGDEAEEAGGEDNGAFLDSLAWALFRKGKFAEARQWLEKAVALPDARNDGLVWDHFGDVCYRLGDVKKARAAWARAAELYRFEPVTAKDGRAAEVTRKLKVLE